MLSLQSRAPSTNSLATGDGGEPPGNYVVQCRRFGVGPNLPSHLITPINLDEIGLFTSSNLRQSVQRLPRLRRLFLLSPAKVSGVRAGLLLNPAAPFALARQFRDQGLPLADIFTFASGVYFRGKITYARRFARSGEQIRIITTNAGLLDPLTHFTPEGLRAFGEVDISEDDPRYHRPLRRDARVLAARLATDGVAILLGSIATAKYREVLLEAFGERLMFPSDFVGRGDMSRGGLMLRAARAGIELPYISVRGAIFKGTRARRIADM